MSVTMSEPTKNGGQVRNFYAGKHIFLTGCTGFYGCLILEKLLRTCTEIGSIYVMIREKKGLSKEEQLAKISNKDVFDTLRAMNPNFMDKVIPIYGDLQNSDLGLSAEDRKRLVNNVNVIIHNAALVYFKAKFSAILRTNVIGTQKLLELAAECPNLNVFVYVSSAYSHHYTNPIEDKFYATPYDLKTIEDIIRADEENAAGLPKERVNKIVGKWLNQYPFSKAVAEGVIEDFARKRSFPCMIYRPALIVHSMREPYPAWSDTKNAAVSMLTMMSLGVLRAAPVGADVPSNYIPADMATSGLLAAIWDYAVHRKTNEPQVYNYASSDWNPMDYAGHQKRLSLEKYPTNKMIWYPSTMFISNLYLFMVVHVVLHMIPATIVDLVLISQRKKPRVLNLVIKYTKQIQALNYFISTNWLIKTDNLKNALSHMNATDNDEFLFDLNRMDWNTFGDMILLYTRKVVNDPMETIPNAKRRLRILKIVHYSTVVLIQALVFFFLFRVMYNLFFY